ncbi:hypothetical protein FRC15_005804 [Serendipita sp. 397]|nr:hypothetical protein FRC15_005804 [Serendipita sp. 397]
MDLDFFLFVFSQAFSQRTSNARERAHLPRQNQEEYGSASRLRDAREQARRERVAAERNERQRREAELKRKEEEAAIKSAQGREQKRKERQHQRAQKKKVTQEVVQEGKRESQRKRSQTFDLARAKDADGVKHKVWAENVDAAGGELLPGMEEEHNVGDRKETLLHIFSRHGDLEMVKWLLDHNAEAEERDSWGRSAFHIALQNDHVKLASLFLEAFPPAEEGSMPIIEPPKIPPELTQEYSLLRLAMDSCSIQMVKLVISNNLFDESDLQDAWDFLSSPAGQAGPSGGYGSENPLKTERTIDSAEFSMWSKIRTTVRDLGSYEEPSIPRPLTPMSQPPAVDPSASEPKDAEPTKHQSKRQANPKKASKHQKNRSNQQTTQSELPNSVVIDDKSLYNYTSYEEPQTIPVYPVSPEITTVPLANDHLELEEAQTIPIYPIDVEEPTSGPERYTVPPPVKVRLDVETSLPSNPEEAYPSPANLLQPTNHRNGINVYGRSPATIISKRTKGLQSRSPMKTSEEETLNARTMRHGLEKIPRELTPSKQGVEAVDEDKEEGDKDGEGITEIRGATKMQQDPLIPPILGILCIPIALLILFRILSKGRGGTMDARVEMILREALVQRMAASMGEAGMDEPELEKLGKTLQMVEGMSAIIGEAFADEVDVL